MIKNKLSYPHYIVSFAFCWSFCFFLLNNAPTYSDYDFFWHAQAGAAILKSKTLILSNNWSFSAPNHYWYNISWLWDVLLHGLGDLFGVEVFYYFISFAYAIIIALIAYYLLLHKDLDYTAVAFTVFFASLILWDFAVPRPHTVTFLFTILYAILLKLYKQKDKDVYLRWLPVIMVIWANTHGGFVVGGLLIFSQLLSSYHLKKKVDYKLIFWGFVCFVCIFINPYFHEIINAVFSTTNSAFTKTIDEWQAFQFGDSFFVFSIYTVLFVISMNITNKNVPFFDKFNSVFWLIMALVAVRNIPVFVILSSLFFTANIQKLALLRKFNFNYLPNNKIVFVFCCTFCFIVSLSLLTFKWKNTEKPIIDPQPSINFIIQKYPNLNFLNDYSLGGAIIYFSQGKQKVFVDGRAGTAYPENVLSLYLNAIRSICLDKFELIKKYNIRGVFTHKDSNMDKILRTKRSWSIVYSDKYFSVYVK